MTIEERLTQVADRAGLEQRKARKSVEQIKQYLILSSPALAQFKDRFKQDAKEEKELSLSDYKNLTEEEANQKIQWRNNWFYYEK
jgi:hypothetical protein